MFTSLIEKPVTLLSLGARAHNRLNATMIDAIVIMMEAHDWTCHICRTRLPGMMEVDHAKGHNAASMEAIRPICQPCHDRQHLLWAAARKRITLLHAPDMSYEEISQLTWALSSHAGREGFHIDRKKVSRDLNARREDAFDALGHDNLEAVFEAIFVIMDAGGKDAAMAKCQALDEHVKIVPAALLQDSPVFETWSRGGFRSIDDDWRTAVVADGFPGYERLRSAGGGLKSRL